MREKIKAILKDVPPHLVKIAEVGTLWQVTLERHCDAGEDGEAIARDLLSRWQWERAKEAPVKDMEEPEPIEIPRFLAPDPLQNVPDALRGLAEPGETTQAMQARLWALWRELNGKLMLNLASPEEIALHTKLHNELHWIAPPVEGED
jgi:hypothetical protein